MGGALKMSKEGGGADRFAAAVDNMDTTVGESSNSSLNEPPEDVENEALWDVAVVERELRLEGNKDERLTPSGKGSNANATGGFWSPETAAGAIGAKPSLFWGDGLAAARLRNLISGDGRRG
jgi:hypothetical protein